MNESICRNKKRVKKIKNEPFRCYVPELVRYGGLKEICYALCIKLVLVLLHLVFGNAEI